MLNKRSIPNKQKMEEFFRDVPRLPRINIRVQQRNGKKSITSIEGLPFDLDLKKLLRHLRKHLATNGTVIIYERIIQLQGDKREETARFLIDHNICSKDDIWIHGPA